MRLATPPYLIDPSNNRTFKLVNSAADLPPAVAGVRNFDGQWMITSDLDLGTDVLAVTGTCVCYGNEHTITCGGITTTGASAVEFFSLNVAAASNPALHVNGAALS